MRNNHLILRSQLEYNNQEALITNKGQIEDKERVVLGLSEFNQPKHIELHFQQVNEKTLQILPLLNGISLITAKAILASVANQLDSHCYVQHDANTFEVDQTDNKYQ